MCLSNGTTLCFNSYIIIFKESHGAITTCRGHPAGRSRHYHMQNQQTAADKPSTEGFIQPIYVEVTTDEANFDRISYENSDAKKTRLIDPSRTQEWNQSIHYNTTELVDDNLTFILKHRDGTEIGRTTERNIKFWHRQLLSGTSFITKQKPFNSPTGIMIMSLTYTSKCDSTKIKILSVESVFPICRWCQRLLSITDTTQSTVTTRMQRQTERTASVFTMETRCQDSTTSTSSLLSSNSQKTSNDSS